MGPDVMPFGSHSNIFRIAIALSIATVCISTANMLLFVDDTATRRVVADIIAILTSGFAAAGAFWASAKCHAHGHLVRMWRLIGGAFTAWLLGSVVWMVYEVRLGTVPFPSLADLFYIWYYPLFLVGIASAPRAQLSQTDRWKAGIEMSIAMVSGLLVFGNVIVAPLSAQGTVPPLVTIFSTLYPALDVGLIWALATLILHRNPLRDTPAALLLAGSLFFMIVADCLYAYRQLSGTYDSGELSDVLFNTSMLIGGLTGLRMAIIAPRLKPGGTFQSADTQLLTNSTTGALFWRRYIPSAVIAFTLLALAWLPGMVFTTRISLLLSGTVVFIALVFIRQLLAIRENQELNSRLRETWAGLQERTAELQQVNIQLQIALDEQQRIVQEQKIFEGKMQQMQKLESLGVLAGGIAHDFNNLLTGIIGNAALVAEMIPEDHEARPFLDDLEKAAMRAAGLTNQMLAYSGKGAFSIARVDLNALTHEMAQLLHASISKKVGLQLELKGRLPKISGDPNQLTQVIMNLITNASEAIDPRPGTIKVRTGIMDVDQEFLAQSALPDPLPAGRYVFLEVSDDGSGMDAETISRIFEPFFTTKFTGRGLGLSATLGIIRGHKGNIHVHSEPGFGTRFTLVFPPANGVEQQSEPDSMQQSPIRSNQTILVVDDESLVRNVAVRLLRQRGYKTIEANHGREAIDAMVQHREEIDAVLLDLMMPIMGGEEAFREIRRIDPSVPVVLSSGFTEKAVSARFSNEVPTGFLQKPFTAQQLTEALQRALTPRQASPELPPRSDGPAGG